MPSPAVWVLLDNRAGNTSQSLGVAEALQLPYSTKKIIYGKHSKAPNFLKGASLMGVDINKSDALKAPWPDVVITAGRRLATVAKYIKKKSGGKTKIVQLMWPGFPVTGFDLIATPLHDKKKSKSYVVSTIGSPHRVTKDVLEREAAIWEKSLQHFPYPRIAVLLGGGTKKMHYTQADGTLLGSTISKAAHDAKASVLLTNSRRTEPEFFEAVKLAISAPKHVHDITKHRTNPYLAFLGLSQAIIVTGDSISMCSEACSAGKPVYIFSQEERLPKKHLSMHQGLYRLGYAKKWSQDTVHDLALQIKNPRRSAAPTLNAAVDIAHKIRELLEV